MSDPGSQRILVTGAGGFVGGKLTRRLQEVFPGATLILADHAVRPGVTHGFDVADSGSVDQLVAECRPTAIVHLAAVSAVTTSFADPRHTWRINTIGTLNVVLAVGKYAPDCHLVFVSSAEVYGRSTFGGAPVNEQALLLPANPYAVTKAAADLLVQEASGRSLFATILRPFNHTGPGQTDSFAVPSFCSQIARIEKGLQPPVIKVGELDDERDFLDVEDVVDCYVNVLQRGRSLENGLVLNIASGAPRRIRDVLGELLAASSVPITVEVDPSRLRATRVPRIVGDAGSAARILGWTPKRAFSDTLAAMLGYWRANV